uniref:Aspartyl/asparaginy/proline hydroxylase domain-containing protein n=1 Tax=Anopheles farauti TaxID=69004 RepID=A0A182R0Y8_9DIPT
MSGDTQPKKRKDKKRKKDDEDTVKETTVHAPKQPSAGAAQAAKEPGDIQMHVHSDHGTGGHWCAKIVFFILLAGLGALIGLIIMENQGVSNEDTPLSESRYSEFFNGWVDENRQDDHHHDEILAAINSLDDHEDEEAHQAAGDHDDDDHDGEDEHDDGAPYAEEEDHDDDEDGTDVQDDDEDEGPAQKLDDDEVEEIFTQQEAAAQQEAAVAADDDDDDDGQEEGADDEDDEDDGITDANDKTNVDDDDGDDDDDVKNKGTKNVQDDNDDDENDDDDKNDNEQNAADDDNDDDDDDDDDNNEEDDDNKADQQNENDDDDDEGDDENVKPASEIDNDDNEENDDDDDDDDDDKDAGRDSVGVTVKIFVGVALLGAAHLLLTSPRAPTRITFNDNDDAERYSGEDDYEYELEQLEEEEEAEQEAELEMDDEEKHLIKQEQEIGAFVPITFEDFNSMYRAPLDAAEPVSLERPPEAQSIQSNETNERPTTSKKLQPKDSLLARKKPPKGAVNKLIYGLHKDPIVIPTNEIANDCAPSMERSEHVSAPKAAAKSVLTALLSEIPSPPIEPIEHERTVSLHPVVPTSVAPNVQTIVREKHVEFLLPDELEQEFERPEPISPPARVDNGSKENLFVPDTSEEEADEYAEEYEDYGEEEEIVYEDELGAEEEDIESVLLNQYGSDEEEEPLTDDNIPPAGGGDYDEASSDVDDSDLMRRLEEKYGKLPASASAGTAATDPDGNEDDEATAAGWTKIPSRAEETDRSYQEELRRAEHQLDEKKAHEALATFDRIILRKPNSIPALVGRARSLDALAEQRRSNAILTEAIQAYRSVIEQELAVDDATLRTIAERCIDRMRFQGQHAKAVEVHKVLIRRFDNEPAYRNQLAVTYLYMNRLAEAKAVLHETLHRWIDDGFALVHYGFIIKTLDQNMELAAQYLQEGIETGHPGTQDGRFYFQLGDALQRLGRNDEALSVYRKGVQKKLFLSVYQRSLYNVDGLRSRPFWTPEQTTYATELELIRAQWTQIRDEGLKLLTSAGVFVNETENLRDRGDWKQLELFSRGARVDRNCARAPVTCRLVEQYFPAARSCKRGQVKFSVMHPGTHVWPHCGPTNCRIRAHLGLSVPHGTHIRVAEETRSWENGRWLIFDDSFEHEVWHNGTETRLVLIVDFWHPDLTETQRRSLSPI